MLNLSNGVSIKHLSGTPGTFYAHVAEKIGRTSATPRFIPIPPVEGTRFPPSAKYPFAREFGETVSALKPALTERHLLTGASSALLHLWHFSACGICGISPDTRHPAPDTSSEPIVISGPPSASQEMILSAGVLDLLAELHRTFDLRRRKLLDRRQVLQRELDSGKNLDFLPETAHVAKLETLVSPEKFRSGRYEAAADLFQRLITTEDFVEFLTLLGYDLLG